MSLGTDIKIMYLNPVGDSSNDRMNAEMAKEYKYPGTSVDIVSLNPATAPPGKTNRKYRAHQALIVTDIVRAARQARKDGYDAMVIADFLDPGFAEAREVSGEALVVRACEASVRLACTISNRYTIIVQHEDPYDYVGELAYSYGCGEKLDSCESIQLSDEAFIDDPERAAALIEKLCLTEYNESETEAFVLGCTPEIGFYKHLQELLTEEAGGFNVPVIDWSIATLKAAEHSALHKQLGWTNSRVWGMQSPLGDEPENPAILMDDYEFGNVIHVPADGKGQAQD